MSKNLLRLKAVNYLRNAVGLSKSRLCVYTCLFGDYEVLSEQPAAYNTNVPFICFTDNRELRSEFWQIRVVEPLLPQDFSRSSRHPKICAHEYLPDFNQSIYIDNSVRIISNPEEIFELLFQNQSHKFACLHHSFRMSIMDEFEEVRRLSYEYENVLDLQRSEYNKLGYDFSDRPIWGGFLLREHHSADVVQCMKIWFANVLRYSRRDQLSFNFAARQARLGFTAHALDIFGTKFHKWPIDLGRKRSNNVHQI